MSKKTTAKQAEALWERLRNAFLEAEDTIEEIIARQAWEPLGYDSFADCWADKLSGVRLVQAGATAKAIEQMFKEGAPAEHVAQHVNGISLSQARTAHRKAKGGIPLTGEYAWREAGPVKKPSPPRFLHIEYQPEDLTELKDRAEALGVKLEEEAISAISAWFNYLEEQKGAA